MEIKAIIIIDRLMMVTPKKLLKGGLYLLLYCVLTTRHAIAQEYTYVHYDVKNGLAGSTVYDLCQDKEGFLWFATEAGVSRFDGTHFKNFTTAEGLPETEILKLFPDSKGRVWMAPFKNTVCYYYKGKIYTPQNDSLLRNIVVKAVIIDFKEDADHNISLNTGSSIYVITDTAAYKMPTPLVPNAFLSVVPVLPGRGMRVTAGDSVFYWLDGKFTFTSLTPDVKPTGLQIDTHGRMPPPRKMTSADMLADRRRIIFQNTYNGSWMADTVKGDHYTEIFLPGKQVSHGIIDNERNIWFSTLGEGVYKLASREFKSWFFEGNHTPEIFSITRHRGTLMAGTSFGKVYAIADTSYSTLDFDSYLARAQNKESANRLTSMRSTDQGELILGFDGYLLKHTPKGNIVNYQTFAVKSIAEVDENTLLVGTGRRVITVSKDNLQVLDTIWPYRSTAVGYYNNQYYVGTSDGLYEVAKDKTTRFLGDRIPGLRQRTSYLTKSPDGTLLIATYGGGIFQMQGDILIRNISTAQGLTSDICRTMFLSSDMLWVGTDKGLNKIDLNRPGSPIKTYTSANGLPSNFINAIYADGNKIYVGSPAGLTFFDERKVYDYSRCNLKILDISTGNKPRDIKDSYRLSYKDNNLKIAFVAISFRSEGDIIYRYRLKGLTDNWDSTRQTVLEYPSLPAGDYELELQAINRFGVLSEVVHIPVFVDAPFWQTLWFNLAVIVFVIAITWLLVAHRFRIIRAREQERAFLQQRMNDLEQMALRSQMNPHFIFNCLNSIQNFIINHDLESSNLYLTEFAHLIRQTLDNSEKGSISINNETLYLKRYLELEKMRFGHSFKYQIVVEDSIDRDFIYIPTMLLQPYVENSIRHGLRYKREGERLVTIQFAQNARELLCIVEDNGIGRQKASEFKSRMHVEYQSKGMSLTADRISILNRQFTELITIEIIDLMDGYNQPTGTKIIIHFPRTVLTKLN